MKRRTVGLVGLVALGTTLVGCAGATTGPAAGDREPRELVVFAAASLTDALHDLAGAFEDDTGVTVLLNLAGSQTLATQIVEGAPVDVLISANTTQMDVVAGAGLVADAPVTLATNRLEVAVEPGNPLGVAGLVDLARSDLVVVLPAEEVPAGRYAQEILTRAGVIVRPASLEQNVRAALAKVAQGEADASIVYASDVVAADGGVTGVPIPVEQNIVATYPMTVLVGAEAPDLAEAFVAFLLSDDAQAVLRAYGFSGP